VLLSTAFIRAATSDITTLPATGLNIIFQEAGYSENSSSPCPWEDKLSNSFR